MKQILKKRLALTLLLIAYTVYLPANAAENGNGTYLMGSKGSTAGVIEPPFLSGIKTRELR